MNTVLAILAVYAMCTLFVVALVLACDMAEIIMRKRDVPMEEVNPWWFGLCANASADELVKFIDELDQVRYTALCDLARMEEVTHE